MLEKLELPARRGTRLHADIAQPQDFDVLVALDTASLPAPGFSPLKSIGKQGSDDQHRPPHQQPALRRPQRTSTRTSPATGQILYDLLADPADAPGPRHRHESLCGDLDRHGFVPVSADQRRARIEIGADADPPRRERRRHLARRCTRATRCGGWSSCARAAQRDEAHRRTPRGELRPVAAHRGDARRVARG